MPLPAFRFKKFSVEQEGAAHPVGTDAVLLGAWANLQGTRRFLDIGTGTGVIALMVAQRLEQSTQGLDWSGVGVELYPTSAELARINFQASPWAHNLTLQEARIQDFSSQGSPGAFDLIVSNPPFFSELTRSPKEARSLGRHTATLPPEELLASAARLLAPEGRFCVVLPEREGRRLCELAVLQGLYWTQMLEVHSRPGRPIERLLIQLEKNPYSFQKATLNIYNEKVSDGYSNAFRALTGDFYLAG